MLGNIKSEPGASVSHVRGWGSRLRRGYISELQSNCFFFIFGAVECDLSCLKQTWFWIVSNSVISRSTDMSNSACSKPQKLCYRSVFFPPWCFTKSFFLRRCLQDLGDVSRRIGNVRCDVCSQCSYMFCWFVDHDVMPFFAYVLLSFRQSCQGISGVRTIFENVHNLFIGLRESHAGARQTRSLAQVPRLFTGTQEPTQVWAIVRYRLCSVSKGLHELRIFFSLLSSVSAFWQK